jgi:hypothetical protein
MIGARSDKATRNIVSPRLIEQVSKKDELVQLLITIELQGAIGWSHAGPRKSVTPRTWCDPTFQQKIRGMGLVSPINHGDAVKYRQFLGFFSADWPRVTPGSGHACSVASRPPLQHLLHSYFRSTNIPWQSVGLTFSAVCEAVTMPVKAVPALLLRSRVVPSGL